MWSSVSEYSRDDVTWLIRDEKKTLECSPSLITRHIIPSKVIFNSDRSDSMVQAWNTLLHRNQDPVRWRDTTFLLKSKDDIVGTYSIGFATRMSTCD